MDNSSNRPRLPGGLSVVFYLVYAGMFLLPWMLQLIGEKNYLKSLTTHY